MKLRQGEEGMGTERGATNDVSGDRRQHHHPERLGCEVAQDELEREEHRCDRRVECGGDASSRATGDEEAHARGRHPQSLSKRRAERRTDLDDWPLASDRSAGPDTDRRGDRLHDRDLGRDATASRANGVHHLWYAVAARLLREAVDQRSIEEAANGGYEQQEVNAE